MGKHSTPQQSWLTTARDFAGAVATLHRKPQGRHSGPSTEELTATGVLRTVRQRPMVAAIALPAAATVGIVASTFAMGQNEAGGTVTAESSAQVSEVDTPTPEASTPSEEELQEEIDQEREAYADSLKDDDRYADAGESSMKAVPKPTKTAQATDAAVGEASGGSDSGDSDASSSGGGDDSGVSGEACSVSSSIESGLTPGGRAAYRAVCAAFPEVESYGGRRSDPGSDHNSGNAVDIMTSSATGDRIKDYLIANRDKLNVKYVIWEQKIYASYTGWSGRPMEDRGSVTANHYDHVHVSVN
ncbi:ligand-binding protein SH3 [Brevibacterium yomogidense]|uniref:ligand-binding protein SH3 n=1 Tax=Brevibacterium yomogidense TaxID=946573 RepID=UPI001E646F65|nr:ligand-binding protein SH3 [Brevibacterium yomogidense]